MCRARFKAIEPLAHVGEEARLGEFAVGNDVDAAIDLLAHGFGDRRPQRVLKRLLVVRLPGIFRLHHVEQLVRPRQAADVRGLDTIGVLLDLHDWIPNVVGQIALRAGFGGPAPSASLAGYSGDCRGKSARAPATVEVRACNVRAWDNLHASNHGRRLSAAFYAMLASKSAGREPGENASKMDRGGTACRPRHQYSRYRFGTAVVAGGSAFHHER